MKVYLDNAASTRLHPEVLEEMLPYLTTNFGNPSATHSFGRKSKAAIETARKKIASHINADSNEIYFCASGTEANNIAIKCSVEDLGIQRIISSKLEHDCVLNTIKYLKESKKIEVVLVNIDKFGIVDFNDLESLLKSSNKKTLVSLMHIQNELGSINDIDKIGELCEKFEALFHCDTVQSVGHFKLDMKKSKLSFISASAHKFNGPLGAGFLFKKKGLKLKTWMHGGGHEKNLRSSTENVSGIIGMAKAIDIAYKNLENDKPYLINLRNRLKEGLLKINPNIQFNESKETSFTIVSVTFPKGLLNDTFFMELDLDGIAVSSGSACASGALNISETVKNLRHEENSVTIRFSFSIFNTKEEIDYVLAFFKKKVQNEN